jgi:hypothetical protein
VGGWWQRPVRASLHCRGCPSLSLPPQVRHRAHRMLCLPQHRWHRPLSHRMPCQRLHPVRLRLLMVRWLAPVHERLLQCWVLEKCWQVRLSLAQWLLY